MNKIRVTAKAIREMPEPKVKVGYCQVHYLLDGIAPFAYTTGTYGWNFDAYDLNGLILTTGYRNMVGKDVNDLARDYEAKAEDIILHTPWSERETAREAVRELREEFRQSVLQRIA